MKSNNSYKLGILFVLLFLIKGCTSNSMYRDSYVVCEYSDLNRCEKNSIQHSNANKENEYWLSFVEYDDQGQLRDRNQMNKAINQYREIAGREDVIILTFVHGWHHSAQIGDGNITSFRTLLSMVSEMESLGSKQENRKKRKVLGVYIGWRGDSISLPYLKELTFWDRKNTAHEVGLHGVTELLLKLEEIVNVRSTYSDDRESRLVVIGHSFGGAVLYTSLQKVLADRFIDSRKNKNFVGNASGFGDLVVLMNPAFEALRYVSLYDLSQEECRGYFSTQTPKLAILTSKTDYATKYAFPAGRSFSTIFEAHVDISRNYCVGAGGDAVIPMVISEGEADRTSVGHFQPLLTHNLKKDEEYKAKVGSLKIENIKKAWKRGKIDGSMNFNGSKLVSLNKSHWYNPYLNISVDKELIPDHNDIWEPSVVSFLRDMIFISITP
jgi:hypothetical protein